MKKRKIFLISVLALALIVCGVYAFKKGRNYVTGKVIQQLAETEEVKKYEEQIKKNMGSEAETDEKDLEEEKKQDLENKPTVEPKKPKSMGDEPLVQNVYARFSASEISTVTAMMANGFTKEEKKYIKSLVFSRVSSAEISQLKEIYYKYNN